MPCIHAGLEKKKILALEIIWINLILLSLFQVENYGFGKL
jgi:hypothetical protein